MRDRLTKVFNFALGETEATIKMYYHPRSTELSSVLPSTSRSLAPAQEVRVLLVKMVTLDGVFAHIPILPEVLVKLDVQGYENRVIAGGTDLLGKTRAAIVEVCMNPLYEGQATFNQIFTQMHGLGLEYRGNLAQVYSTRDGHVIHIDAVFVRNKESFERVLD